MRLLIATRPLTKERTVSVLSVLALALPMAVIALVLGIADAAILRPLKYPQAEQLARLEIDVEERGQLRTLAPSLNDVQRWQASGIFSAVTAFRDEPFGCVLNADLPRRLNARRTTEDGSLRRLPMALGRDFSAEDLEPSASLVAILGHGFWQTHFGRSDVIGQTIRCDAEIATIIGVLPGGVEPHVDLFLPLRLSESARDRRGTLDIWVRVKDRTLSEAENALSSTESKGDIASNAVVRVRLRPLAESIVERNAPTVQTLVAAAAVALAIGIVNIAGLLLARNARRRRELAVRLAMGATQRRLALELMLEGLALSLGAGVVGAFTAWLALDPLISVLPITLPTGAVRLWDWRVLSGILAIAIAVGTSLGILMASQARVRDLSRELNASSGGLGPALSRRGAQWIIGGQVALAVVLVALGGVLLRSYMRVMAVDLGFEPRSMVAFAVSPIEVEDPDQKEAFYVDLLRRVRALPGVDAVGLVDHFVLSDTSVSAPVSAQGRSRGAALRQIMGDYFAAIGVRSLQGVLPQSAGTPIADNTAVLNQSAASHLFGDDALGKTVTVSKRTYTVVAVIPDLVHGGPLAKVRPEVFLPYDPASARSKMLQAMTVVVRTRNVGPTMAASLQAAIRSVGPKALIEDVRSASEWLGDRVAEPRQKSIFFGTLGTLGATLMVLGVFSATAYLVSRRTNEISLRLALGAEPSVVVRECLRLSAVPVGIGLAVGVYLATFVTPTVRSFLFHTEPNDPMLFVAASLAVGGSAILAAWLPARRAASVDPVSLLRQE